MWKMHPRLWKGILCVFLTSKVGVLLEADWMKPCLDCSQCLAAKPPSAASWVLVASTAVELKSAWEHGEWHQDKLLLGKQAWHLCNWVAASAFCLPLASAIEDGSGQESAACWNSWPQEGQAGTRYYVEVVSANKVQTTPATSPVGMLSSKLSLAELPKLPQHPQTKSTNYEPPETGTSQHPTHQ